MSYAALPILDRVREGLGTAGPEEVARGVAGALGIEFASGLSGRAASAEFVAAVPIAFARRHLVLGLAGEGSGWCWRWGTWRSGSRCRSCRGFSIGR